MGFPGPLPILDDAAFDELIADAFPNSNQAKMRKLKASLAYPRGEMAQEAYEQGVIIDEDFGFDFDF